MAAAFVHLARSALIDQLQQLKEEVRQAAEPLTEEELWTRPLEPGNSLGHLILHLTGNLNHFVAGQLGQSGYLRNREREFSEPDPPGREKLLADLEAAVAAFGSVVGRLTEEQLQAAHPEPRFGPVFKALVHLVSHFAVHRGQISYIVRLLKKKG